MKSSRSRLLLLAAAMILLSGCTAMKVEDYAGTQPVLDLEGYFSGPVTAWGIVQDRGGKVTRQFRADMHGERDGDLFLLHEKFAFDDGERMTRTWRLKRIDEHRYEGTAGDVVGTASVAVYGRAMNLNYTLKVPVGESVYSIDFDDWLFLQEDGVIVNRATMRKFGFRVGELTVMMQKGRHTAERPGS